MSDERLISIGDAARELGVSITALRRWVDAGKVPAVKLPSKERRFTREQIDAIKEAWGYTAIRVSGGMGDRPGGEDQTG